jgi:hypothetical protein
MSWRRKVGWPTAKIFRSFGSFSPFFHLEQKIVISNMVARWFACKPKIQIWLNFGGPWNGKCCHNLSPFGVPYCNWAFWPFGILSGRSVYISQYWYAVPRKIWQTWFRISLRCEMFRDFNIAVLLFVAQRAATWHNGHRVRLKYRRSRFRIPSGCKILGIWNCSVVVKTCVLCIVIVWVWEKNNCLKFFKMLLFASHTYVCMYVSTYVCMYACIQCASLNEMNEKNEKDDSWWGCLLDSRLFLCPLSTLCLALVDCDIRIIGIQDESATIG